MTKPTKRDLWIRGWARWVNWAAEEETEPGAERQGFRAAAHDNENCRSGNRPTVAQGPEECPYGAEVVVDDRGCIDGIPFVLGGGATGEQAFGLPPGRYRLGDDGEVEEV